MSDKVSGGGPLPDSTPISELLSDANAKLLTPGATKLTKGDLLSIRLNSAYHIEGDVAAEKVSVSDINSVGNAFDHQYGTHPDTAGASFIPDPASGDSCCCCCSTAPCCCCTAAAQSDPFTH